MTPDPATFAAPATVASLGGLADTIRSLAIPEAGAYGRPPRDDVRAIERWVADALTGPDFLVECLRVDLAARAARGRESTSLVPFCVVPELGVRVALAYWEPGREAGAHEHASWTVTAVVHNQLEIETYDWERARTEQRLVPKRTFPAGRGRVGHIYDPCIHNPRNPTAAWSISLHVFAPPGESQLGEGAASIAGLAVAGEAGRASPPAALDAFIHARGQEDRRRAAIAALSGVATPGAIDLLRTLHDDGDTETRELAAAALANLDPERGSRLLERAVSERPGLRSRLVRADLGVPLAVIDDGAKVELVTAGATRLAFVRVDSWARGALRFIAENDSFDVAGIPGGLGSAEKVALSRALVASGLYR